MKQKVLTEKQHEVLGRLEAVLKEVEENKIRLVFDEDDYSLTAFNAENVNIPYSGRNADDTGDEKIDWDSCYIIKNFNADSFNNQFDSYYLNFEEV